MIKLEYAPQPVELTAKVQAELTDEFEKTGKSVWKKTFIEKALLDSSFYKCAYSEALLQTESKYMEIDHFYCKSIFPKKVVEWKNLLPSIKTCNGTKWKHNVATQPIVNPYIDDPKAHLYLQNYRFYGITEKGKTTIPVVALNDKQHFVDARFAVGNQILETIDDLNEEKEDLDFSNSRKSKKFFNKIKGLMQQGTKKNEYAATVATVLLESSDFIALKAFLETKSLWDADFQKIEIELKFCFLGMCLT